MAEMDSRHLAAPEPTARKRSPSAAQLIQPFLDARWPLYVNTVFLVFVVYSVSHYSLVYTPSAAQRLLQLTALLAVAGLFVLGTWLRSHVVEGLVAAVYGYRVCVLAVRSITRGPAGAVGLPSALRIAQAIGFWGLLVVMAILCVYFAGRFARRCRSNVGDPKRPSAAGAG
jgi:hypothetical protein